MSKIASLLSVVQVVSMCVKVCLRYQLCYRYWCYIEWWYGCIFVITYFSSCYTFGRVLPVQVISHTRSMWLTCYMLLLLEVILVPSQLYLFDSHTFSMYIGFFYLVELHLGAFVVSCYLWSFLHFLIINVSWASCLSFDFGLHTFVRIVQPMIKGCIFES